MQIKKDALHSQFLKQHANCSQIVGKTDWQRAGHLNIFNLAAEYFFVAGQFKLAMIGLVIISSWCVWVKTGFVAYILLRLGSHQRRNIIKNLENRWKKSVLFMFHPATNLVGVFKHDFYFPFHIWDVIPTPLTFTPSFLRWLLHHQPVYSINISTDFHIFQRASNHQLVMVNNITLWLCFVHVSSPNKCSPSDHQNVARQWMDLQIVDFPSDLCGFSRLCWIPIAGRW
jgi:hypothetical protein